MRVIDSIHIKKPFISLEFFPPRDKALWPDFFRTVETLKAADPAYVSVTYGAFGSTREFTKEISIALKKNMGVEPMPHLTCVGASPDTLRSFLGELRAGGIENVLALRGDPPEEGDAPPEEGIFAYASDLVTFIKSCYPQMGIAVAGYPEGHPDSADKEEDIKHLKFKCDQGADFIITQLFFDNALYWDFVGRARSSGITQPIVPGILPVATLSGLKKILSKDCASIPSSYMDALEKADTAGGRGAVQALGVEYAVTQIRGLLEKGVPGIHLYTLNRAKSCLDIFRAIGLTGKE